LNESVGYIASRIRLAGGSPAHMFTREAVILIHEYSRGIPRTINVLADNALVSGFASQQRPVTTQLVRDVCIDFDISAPRPVTQAKTAVRTAGRASVPLSSSEQQVLDSAVAAAPRELRYRIRQS
jgi:general secretion pathway protein A